MCRWFAYLSPTEPTLLADVLITPANAITKQCSEHYLPGLLPHGQEKDLIDAPDQLVRLRNSLLNMDGLGIAWYTDTASAFAKGQTGVRPALYKSQSPPTNDFNFKSLCENTESSCLFAHIRASSGAVVAPVNNHPFVFGRHVFMHNGVITEFTKMRREMSEHLSYECYANVKGSTDSEHAAALYMTYLGGSDTSKEAWEKPYSLTEMKDALQRTIITILKIQKKFLAPMAVNNKNTGTSNENDSEKPKSQANSLNFCVTDGRKAIASRFRNHATEQPPSLYWSESAGKKLNRKYPGHPDKPSPPFSSPTSSPSLKAPNQATKTTTTITTSSTPPPHEEWETVHDTQIANEIEDQEEEFETKQIGKHTIIASEPTTYDEKEWHLIGKNCLLMVDEDGVESEVLLEYDASLNA